MPDPRGEIQVGSKEDLLTRFDERHPSTMHVLKYFAYSHLPAHLKEVSKPVAELAVQMVARLDDGPELTVGLRKLLEGKDCLVRARLDKKE